MRKLFTRSWICQKALQKSAIWWYLMNRREYLIHPICVNGVLIKVLIIDTHLDKHSDHMNDQLVQVLVRKLHGEYFEPVKIQDTYQYFATVIWENGYWYRLVWLMEREARYIGVVTAFRDRRIK